MNRNLLALFFLCAACAAPPATVEESVESELVGRELVVASVTKHFPGSGRSVVRTKILDPDIMVIREVTHDHQGGAGVAFGAARAENEQAWRNAHGAANDELLVELERSGAGTIELAIEAESIDDVPQIKDQIVALGGEILDEREVFLVAGVAREHAATVPYFDHVVAVGRHKPKQSIALNLARDTGQGQLAVAAQIGWGDGVRAALWDLDTCVKRTHADFSGVDWQPRNTATTCSPGSWAGHATAVAGVFAADRGSAGTVGLYRGKIFDVDDRSSTAVTDMFDRDPHVINASFTISPFDGKTIDERVYNQGIFVFNGSANDPNDTANCYAYNALCVGGYNHRSTYGAFSDDTVSGGASHLNYEGREFPQVVGPFSVGRTAHHSGYGHGAWSGTSFSSPAVAGLGALLLTNYMLPLWEKPALMRAVLMASAQAHPIIDGGLRIPNPTDGIDDRTGVGAPNGDRAKAIMDAHSYVERRATPSQLGLQTSFSASANERVRVVLTWNQCPGYNAFDPVLAVDLDLSVNAPSQFRYQTNTYTNPSFADNWEVVEFVTQRSGTINVHVSAAHFNACAAEGGAQRVPMAIAWTKEAAPLLLQQVAQ